MAKHLMVIGIDADLMVSLFSMKISDDLTVGRKACSYQNSLSIILPLSITEEKETKGVQRLWSFSWW